MTLLIAYGNPGRGDDGLGPALAERLEAKALPDLRIVTDYQLTVEHALLLTDATRVVFADAEINSTAPFTFSPVSPASVGDVTSHSLSPRTVLTIAEALYDAMPRAFVLGIAGSEFGEVREGLSRGALGNLDLAEGFMLKWLESSNSEHQEGRASTECV